MPSPRAISDITDTCADLRIDVGSDIVNVRVTREINRKK